MGVAGVLARTFTGMFLGMFFISRTDRNLMIQGFHNSDRGYASYIGYLHVVAMHRNPVRVAFCQILLDLVYKQHVIVNKGKFVFICNLSNQRRLVLGQTKTEASIVAYWELKELELV